MKPRMPSRASVSEVVLAVLPTSNGLMWVMWFITKLGDGAVQYYGRGRHTTMAHGSMGEGPRRKAAVLRSPSSKVVVVVFEGLSNFRHLTITCFRRLASHLGTVRSPFLSPPATSSCLLLGLRGHNHYSTVVYRM